MFYCVLSCCMKFDGDHTFSLNKCCTIQHFFCFPGCCIMLYLFGHPMQLCCTLLYSFLKYSMLYLLFINWVRGLYYLLTNWLAYLYRRIQSPRPDVMPDRREVFSPFLKAVTEAKNPINTVSAQLIRFQPG